MTPNDKEVKYRGRKTSRTGSEQRRRAILEAALRIVIREGVRGVRHRAVAKEADVPLSATTYYFKDISDLIADTFTLFAEKGMSQIVDPFEERVAQHLSQYEPEIFAKGDIQLQIVNDIARLVAEHICGEIKDNRGHVMAEQAFLHEALRDKRLQSLAMQYRHNLEQGLRQMAVLFGSNEPDLDAKLLLTFILHLEYEALIDPAGPDIDKLNEMLLHLFSALLLKARREQ